MSPSKRIALNVAATYGRSLYRLLLGLLCGRWSLMALGQVDYGLNGLVGGMTVFITYLNTTLAGAVSRFYAFAVGKASATHDDKGLEECRKWFSIAVMIHSILPTVLVMMGYPIGVWAVRHFLTIPEDRVEDCVWVFRFVCASCWIAMVTIPYNAMYQAKQYIAELTVYTFVTSTLNVVFLYYMITHPGVWLKGYAFWSSLLAIAPQIIIVWRAICLFPECRFRVRYCLRWSDMRNLFSFAGWNAYATFVYILRGQGVSILINKYFGPALNATYAMARMVNGHAASLSGALIEAFRPAVTSAYGSENLPKMRMLAHQSSKFGVVLMLVFFIPLALELKEVMHLWLLNPPELMVEFCWALMVLSIVDTMSNGASLAVAGGGRVAGYQMTTGVCHLLAFPLVWSFVAVGWGPLSVVGALIIMMVAATLCRVVMAQRLTGLSIRYWLFRISLPVCGATIVTFLCGYLPQLFLQTGLVRIVLTTLVCEGVFLPMTWLLVLDTKERCFVKAKLQALGRKAHAHETTI